MSSSQTPTQSFFTRLRDEPRRKSTSEYLKMDKPHLIRVIIGLWVGNKRLKDKIGNLLIKSDYEGRRIEQLSFHVKLLKRDGHRSFARIDGKNARQSVTRLKKRSVEKK